MIVVTKTGTPDGEIVRLMQKLSNWNLKPEKSVGERKVVIGLVGDTASLEPAQIQGLSPSHPETI